MHAAAGYSVDIYVDNMCITTYIVDKFDHCPALCVSPRPRWAQFCAFCDLVDSRFPLALLALRAR